MDIRLKFLNRRCGGKGGTREGKLSVPIGHGTFCIVDDDGIGKSVPYIKLMVQESCGEIQGDLT